MKKKKKPVKAKKLTAIEEKRVAILKDALLQIRIKAFNVKSGNGYVVNDDLDDKIQALHRVADIISAKGENTELQKFINKLINKNKPCEVCAKGALLISSIRKFNNLSLKEANEGEDGDCLNEMASSKACDIFGDDNADLMEDVFEHGIYSEDAYGNDDNHWSSLDDDDRLIRIFKNAIRNRGTFMPDQEKF